MANNANNTPTGDKTSKFLTAIQKYADEQRDKINSEVEQFKQAELKKAADDGLKDAYTLIHKEMDAMRTSISSEMAKYEAQGKAVLFKKRSEITADVFDRAKAKLEEFTLSDKYKEQLISDAKDIADYFGESSVTLYLRSKDMEFSDKLTSLFNGSCTAQAGSDIFVGGIRAVCYDSKIMIDKTLDTKLEEQKEWFYQNSGLKVY